MTLRSFVFVIAVLGTAGAAAAHESHGFWARGDGIVRVRIAPCGAALCATNEWVNDPSGNEKVGDKLVLDVRPTAAGLEGKAYDPKRDLTFGFELRVARDRMTTRGCLLGGLFCKSVDWTRIGS